jgi:hypothetical protein
MFFNLRDGIGMSLQYIVLSAEYSVVLLDKIPENNCTK